jgi:uncharacterized membrane protein YdjX (TVP38/TMEM64 family)
MVPLSVLVAATALIFGPWLGAWVSLSAGVLSAIGGFLMGRWLWGDAVRRLAGANLARFSREIGERGIVAMMVVRLVPIGPFTIVNMVAGASHVRLRDFAIGTTVGMVPGIVGISILADRAAAAVADPGMGTIMVAIGVAAAFALSILWLQRRLR